MTDHDSNAAVPDLRLITAAVVTSWAIIAAIWRLLT